MISDLISIPDQINLVNKLKPKIAVLNFHTSGQKRVTFYDGVLLRYIWTSEPEARLVVTQDQQRDWDVQRLARQINFDNTIRKTWSYNNLSYQNYYELNVIKAYLYKFTINITLLDKFKLLIDQQLPGFSLASKTVIKPNQIMSLTKTFSQLAKTYGNDNTVSD